MDRETLAYKQRLIDQKKQGIVLDIDETLSWTIGYWVEEMQKRFGNPEKLSVEEMVAKYKYAQQVPYWQTSEALEWMKKSREDDKLQENLPLISQANHFARKVDGVIPVVGYLTIRPRTVLAGTIKWLEKHDFPKAEVLARPTEIKSEDGDKWKADALSTLYPQVRGIVDDKLAMAKLLPSDYPGTVFLFGNKKERGLKIRIVSCKDWGEVYMEVKKKY